ncbi:hypothetical protein [Bacillus cereus group sp. TH152-1LC]|uniref:hypothetical protein n=1 Tax=Bacillus cereus group sp. TH152-1LC TaxID=3018060 RepID=UPI0022E41572|nr:hypothetical protein [Bacillus cereus group sp. TH152-1LC]MDA1675514.1 hypothetical protein [Bacillus cereus group sp. TH152-1LC]
MTQIQESVASISHVSGLALLEQSKQYDALYENELKYVFGDCIELDIPTQKREEDIEKEMDLIFGFTVTAQVSETPTSEVEEENSEIEETNSEVEVAIPEIEETNSEIKETAPEIAEINSEVEATAPEIEETNSEVKATVPELETPNLESKATEPSPIDSENIESPVLHTAENSKENVLSEEEQKCHTLIELIFSKTLATKGDLLRYLRKEKITYQKSKSFKDAFQAIKDSKFDKSEPKTHSKEKINKPFMETHDREKMSSLFMNIFKFSVK